MLQWRRVGVPLPPTGIEHPTGSKGAVNIIFTLYYFSKISHSNQYMKMFLIKGRSKKTPAGIGS